MDERTADEAENSPQDFETAAASSDSPEDAPTLTPEILEELQKKAEERDKFLDELRRSKADLENFRKRVRRERPAWEEQAVGRFVRELLQVVDNFDRAVNSIEGGQSSEAGLEAGVRLIHQMLHRVLSENGVEEIPAERQSFDPEFHEALVQEEVEDVSTGEVLEVLEKGYRYRSTVLRPSKVKVALNVSGRRESDEDNANGANDAE